MSLVSAPDVIGYI